MEIDIVIIGGGAAGFFAAIAAKTAHPEKKVVILEKSGKMLAKVLLTGGGRCNLTHQCEDPKELASHYPRGSKELLSLFHSFNDGDTMEWFESKGIGLKVEADGRVFPQSNRSETIVNCLIDEAKKVGVEINLNQTITDIEKCDGGFKIVLEDKEIRTERLLIASGSSPEGYAFAKKLGHTIVTPIPSLFAINAPSSPYLELSGIAVSSVQLCCEGSFTQEGALLLTHFGFSGPSILKLSSFAARFLHERGYKATLTINWLPHLTENKIEARLLHLKNGSPNKNLISENPFGLPKKLWKKMAEEEKVPSRLGDLSVKGIAHLAKRLHEESFMIDGKTTHKEEFVTAGGISLKEINFKTMESKICPGLFFAGEILDIDGVTGGFNLQNCWTTGFVAGSHL